MSTKKSSKTKQQKAKKGTKPQEQVVDEQAQVAPLAEESTPAQTETAPGEEMPVAEAQAEPAANVEQSVEPAAEPPAEAPASDSTTLVWPEQPECTETDVAFVHIWTTACGRYRVSRVVNKLPEGGAHFNAEIKNGADQASNGTSYHSLELAKDGCGRPRDYRTLNRAIEVCVETHPGRNNSDSAAMVAYAAAKSIDTLPAIEKTDATGAKTGDPKAKTERKPRAPRGQD